MLNPPAVCLCWHGGTAWPKPAAPPHAHHTSWHCPEAFPISEHSAHSQKCSCSSQRSPASFSSLSNSYFPVQPQALERSRTSRTLLFLYSQGRDHHCKPCMTCFSQHYHPQQGDHIHNSQRYMKTPALQPRLALIAQVWMSYTPSHHLLWWVPAGP